MLNKKLIIVDSTCNLLLAVQLKRTVLSEDDVDLILGYTCLEERRNNKVLNRIFSDVFYFGQEKDYIWHISHLLSPGRAIKDMIGDDQPRKYSDIFFWNPDYFMYYFFKFYKIIHHSVKWHVYGDAISQYLADVPDIDPAFPEKMWMGRILNRIDWLFWKVPRGNIAKMHYDFYMFQPEKFFAVPQKEHKGIPTINAEDTRTVSLFNEIFNYRYEEIKEKVIYIDTARDGNVDSDEIIGVLRKIQQHIGKDNLVVKPHPRVDLSIYSQLDLNFLDKSIPWELYCMNGGLDGKVIACQFSSAVCLSYFWFNQFTELVSVMKFTKSDSTYGGIELNILKQIKEDTGKVFLPNSMEELMKDIDTAIDSIGKYY